MEAPTNSLRSNYRKSKNYRSKTNYKSGNDSVFSKFLNPATEQIKKEVSNGGDCSRLFSFTGINVLECRSYFHDSQY